MRHTIKTVYVGMSGGVDSSVAAAILKEQGYDVYGMHLRCWIDGSDCTSDQAETDALRVAARLDIPFEVLNFTKEYENRVLKHFYSEYLSGRTPNPDILCNSEIKFGIFFDEVLKRNPGAYIATGHYARVKTTDAVINKRVIETNFLASGIDKKKDQSYFLYRLASDSKKLGRCIFPVGTMIKSKVRRYAEIFGLPNYDKPDSQGICFIGGTNLRQFLQRRIQVKRGLVVNSSGKVIGEHMGLPFYTIGQRHGFSIKEYSDKPLYVVDKIPDKNLLLVGSRSQACSLEFQLVDLCLSKNFDTIASGRQLSIRIRNLGEKIPCSIFRIGVDRFHVKLNLPEFGVAPGQSGVIYYNEILMGGGIIASVKIHT